MSYLSATPAPPRLAELEATVAARITTAAMSALCTAGIHAGNDGLEKPTTEPPWVRCVVVLGSALWSTQEQPSRHRVVRMLVRAELEAPRRGATAYKVGVELEAVLTEAFSRIVGWKPSAADIQATRHADFQADPVFMSFETPFWRRSRLTEAPEHDPDRGLWFMTDEFRAVVGPV